MIVKYKEEGWEIVSHYAHGLLAGKIAQQLLIELRPQYWVETLTSIIEHDDHLLDFEEQNYLSRTSMPLDFTMSDGTDLENLKHARRVYNNALQKSQLIALLVGRHLEFLNASRSQKYKPLKEFLMEIKSSRKKQRALYKMHQKDEDNCYDILLFCDRLSLILCQEETPKTGRQLEINSTILGETYFVQRTEKGMNVVPWCFKSDQFELEYEFRVLTQPTFRNNKELKESLDSAKVRLRKYLIHK